MMKLTLQNVRCFADPGPVSITPLTILIGENSTGKSSFLALIRIAYDLVKGNLSPNFNKDPFFLGAYDQIAHFRGGSAGRSRNFSIEISTDVDPQVIDQKSSKFFDAKLRYEFEKIGSQPVLGRFEFICGKYRVMVNFADEEDQIQIILPSWKGKMGSGSISRGRLIREVPWGLHYFIVRAMEHIEEDKKPKNFKSAEGRNLIELFQATIGNFRLKPYASAPVRSRPERTYNPIEDTPKAEGTHVPMYLAKMKYADRSQWRNLITSVNKFGNSAGLFKELNLRTLGKSESDPFQIIVKISGPNTNLIDVGYGVSQVLPLITDLNASDGGNLFLMQQPEVHLHPKAQAELGTFLSEFVASGTDMTVVETHSDYLVDRIRMEVRDKNKKIKCEDVTILYFERDGLDVKIHQMSLDREGNLIGAPPSYREFFLGEEMDLFGI